MYTLVTGRARTHVSIKSFASRQRRLAALHVAFAQDLQKPTARSGHNILSAQARQLGDSHGRDQQVR
jgi:hypothetical protein